MADRRNWEYSTVQIKGDLAQLGEVCVDGWRFREFVVVEILGPVARFVVLLEREKSSLIT